MKAKLLMISTWLFWISTFQNKHLPLITLSLLLISLVPTSAQAQEGMSFKAAQNYKERKVTSFVQEQSQTSDVKYILSSADLNDDGVNEYIVKPKTCSANNFCNHTIIAYMNDKPIVLLSTIARSIIVKNTHHYGVKDITTYSSPMNDFQKSEYQWNPFSYVYEQKDVFKTR